MSQAEQSPVVLADDIALPTGDDMTSSRESTLEPDESSSACLIVPTPEPPWHAFARQVAGIQGNTVVPLPNPNQIELEVIAPARRPLPGVGRLENNLSRKGIFEMRPDRTFRGTVERTDLVGKTTLTFTLGALGPLEMDLVAWTMGQWRADRDRISFSLREVARSFGLSWKGQLGHEVKEALRRIRGVTITGRVWDAQQRKHTTKHFGIFDEVDIVEERATENGPATAPATVTVTLSAWLVGQLRAGQYSDIDWDGYKGRLGHTHFARRLFLLIESQEGDGDGLVYRTRIDKTFADTMATDEFTTNPSRFRSRLRKAGEQIADTHRHYEAITVKAGERRGEYWLEVRRSAEWLRDRLRRRQARRMSGIA